MSIKSKLSMVRLIPLMKRVDKGPLTPELARELVIAVHNTEFDFPKDSSPEMHWQLTGMFLLKAEEEFLKEKGDIPNAKEFVTWVKQEHEALKPQK